MGSKGSKDDFSQVPIRVGEERLLSKIEFQLLVLSWSEVTSWNGDACAPGMNAIFRVYSASVRDRISQIVVSFLLAGASHRNSPRSFQIESQLQKSAHNAVTKANESSR